MNVFFELAATWRDELIDLCVNRIKYKFYDLITVLMRCLEDKSSTIQEYILPLFVDVISLEKRITSICDTFDSINKQNSCQTVNWPSCIRDKRWYGLPDNEIPCTGTRSESIVKSGASNLWMGIGLCPSTSSENRRRSCKRAVTCNNLGYQDIDHSDPLALQCWKEEKQIIFQLSPPKDEITVCEARSRQTRHRRRGDEQSSLTYRIHPLRENWKNSRLRISIYRTIPKNGHCLAQLRPLRVRRLKLPCKPIYLMLEIFQADPTVLEFSSSLMRIKFTDGVHNVCTLLNNILGQADTKELKLICEIQSDRINFKLKSRCINKSKLSKVCLLVMRVPICRDFHTSDTVPEQGISSRSLESKDAGNRVEPIDQVQEKEENTDECKKSKTFYSPCSNDSLASSQNERLNDSAKETAKDKEILLKNEEILSTTIIHNHRVYENDSQCLCVNACTEKQYRNQFVQCERIVRYSTIETDTIARSYLENNDVGDNGRIDNEGQTVLVDTRIIDSANPCCSTQVSRVSMHDSAIHRGDHFETINRYSSVVYPITSSSLIGTPRTARGSKRISIEIIRQQLDKDWSIDDKRHFCSSQSSRTNLNANDIESSEQRVFHISEGFNKGSSTAQKKLGPRDDSGEYAVKFDKTVRSKISANSTKANCHIRQSKIRLVSRMLEPRPRSPTTTFVKTTLQYVRKPTSPTHYTMQLSSNSVLSIESILSRNETHYRNKIEPNYSFFSRMKKRALAKTHRIKSRIRGTSIKSLHEIKHLIRRKLGQVLHDKKNKATSTSNLILKKNDYVISVSKGKSKHKQIICEPYFVRAASPLRHSVMPKSIDEKSNSRYACEYICACSPGLGSKENNRKESWTYSVNNQATSSYGSHISQNLRESLFNSMLTCRMKNTIKDPSELRTRNHCGSYRIIADESKRDTEEGHCSNKACVCSGRRCTTATSQWNNSRKRNFLGKKHGERVSEMKHRHKEHSIMKVSRKANKRYDSDYRDKRQNGKRPSLSNDECFMQVSKLIGLTDTCERCISDIESDFRIKLSEYVALCRSARDSLVKGVPLEKTAFMGSQRFPHDSDLTLDKRDSSTPMTLASV